MAESAAARWALSAARVLRVAAALSLAVLLIVMFPANVYASQARRSEHSPNTPLPQRTAMQCVFIAATLFVALAS